MLYLEESTMSNADTELEIYNSNPYFNQLSTGKDELTRDEVLTEITDSKNMGAERFLIKDGELYVGIMDYLMRNPNDDCTWLGLLLIKKEYQSKGYGYQTLNLFHEQMKDRQVDKFRIGVIVDNEPAHAFWKRQGFTPVKTSTIQDKLKVMVYEKKLNKDL